MFGRSRIREQFSFGKTAVFSAQRNGDDQVTFRLPAGHQGMDGCAERSQDSLSLDSSRFAHPLTPFLLSHSLGKQGKTVLVKTNSGCDFKGVMHSLDGYLNLALEQAEEWVGGECRRTYGDCFIRGNNVLYITAVTK